MEFVQNFTLPDFQVGIFTLPISPNFNSFSKKKTQKINDKLEKLEKFTPLATNFTLLPALTGWTNSTSAVEWSAVHKNKSSTVQNSTVGQSVIQHCVGESISALEKEEER